MAQPAFEPLYAKVRSALVARLIAGEWRPGALLPGESAIAAQMGVSLGTVRKAVDSLVADGVLRRHQGKGTFVTEQTPERANFHFFRLVDARGERVLPEAGTERTDTAPAGAEAAARLGVAPGDPVVRILRTRGILARPAMFEQVVVPAALMPGLEAQTPLPNALYPHYQAAHGISVVSAEDRLSAIAAGPDAARALGVPEGTPLLMADRVATDLVGRAVEWRRSQFHCDGVSYSVTLG